MTDDERDERYMRGLMREAERTITYGMRTGPANCDICGKFKSRPSSVCGVCGNDPVTHNGDRREYDRAHGYAGLVRD